jgi:transcriptional regulator with XRE-family HTH domain
MKRRRLQDALKAGIHQSGKPLYRLAKESGVSQPIIYRFVSGERDIRLETAEKLAASLGLELEKTR